VESHEHSERAIREGDSPFVGSQCPSSLPPISETWDFNQDFRKSQCRSVAFCVSTVLIALSVVGSCLAAPFLAPFFQLVLVPPVLLAMVVGSIGGWCRTWWLTGLIWTWVVFLYVWHDLATNPFGYKSLYSTYVMDNPPPGFMYFHSWQQLYDITIIPLSLGVAIITHAWVAERRRLRDAARLPAPSETAGFRKNEE
jgi:hypothetical protein